MSKSKLMGRLLRTSILAGAAVAVATPAVAQDDEIVITGTRIKRTDLEAPSPVTSISQEELTLTNTVNNEQFLNSLPQAIPGFDSTSNNPGNGTATANLRNLGSSRTLVLVDGTRWVTFNGGSTVDLNSIPSSLVSQIDVVTGGASAVYGSDALAGVVNFSLRDDFEGMEISTSYQQAERGDGNIMDVSFIAGGSFADGRGNAVVAAGYTDRQAVFAGDRSVTDDVLVDNGDGFGFGGSSGVPGTRYFGFFSGGVDFTSIGYTSDGTDCSDPGGTVAPTLGGADCVGDATFAPDGTPIPWVGAGLPGTTTYNYAPVNYLQLPQERYNMAGFVNYDITDDIEFKGRAVFSSNVVAQELAPTPFFNTVTVNSANLTADQAALLDTSAGGGFDADGNQTIFIGRRMREIGPRNSEDRRESMQVAGSFAGTWHNDWNWEVFGSFSKPAGPSLQTGNVSISAMRDAVSSGDCTIFGANQFSQECVDRVARTGAAITDVEQTNIVATTDGSTGMTMPNASSPIQFAAGYEYRESKSDFKPDSVLGPDVAGFNQSLPIKGGFIVNEVFGELYVPVVEGAEWADEFSLNGAFRHSDYSTVGGTNTYSVGAEWAPNSQIRFRAQQQRAVRAPNVNELFSPQTNGFPGAQDPCSSGLGSYVAGNAALDAACEANGVPAASVGAALQGNSQIEGLFGGNPGLDVETSDTLTVGFVAQPESVDGLIVTVDYYKIEVEDFISTIPVQVVLDGCFLEGNNDFCSLVNRQQGGAIDFISLTNQNVAFAGSEGVDISVEYSWETEFGDFAIDVLSGYKMSSEFQSLPGETVDDCTGYFGADYGRCGEPEPEWKHNARLDWSKGDLLASLRWRYVGEVQADNYIDPNNASPEDDLFVDSIDAYNFFDLSGSYQLNDTFTLNAGIINLTDEEPPALGDCCSEQANTWPATYNPLGRQFFVGAKASF